MGAVYSGIQLFRPAPHYGEVVAVVREARTERPIADATVEIFTPQDALVTTLSSASQGQVRQPLKEGVYRVRVSHPRFGAEVRQVMVQPGQTAEVHCHRTPLTGGTSPVGKATRAVSEGVGVFRGVIRGLGL